MHLHICDTLTLDKSRLTHTPSTAIHNIILNMNVCLSQESYLNIIFPKQGYLIKKIISQLFYYFLIILKLANYFYFLASLVTTFQNVKEDSFNGYLEYPCPRCRDECREILDIKGNIIVIYKELLSDSDPGTTFHQETKGLLLYENETLRKLSSLLRKCNGESVIIMFLSFLKYTYVDKFSFFHFKEDKC